MAYERITLEGFINEFSTASKGSNPRRFCFILGAGASISSGIKTGQQLVEIWEKELTVRNRELHESWKTELEINENNRASFYSKYYDRRFDRNPRDGYNYLENEMEGKKPSIGYVALAHLLTKSPNNVVITTNFDHLTEDAISDHQQIMPRVIGHEALAHYGKEETSRPLIIKIHRDLLLSPKNKESELEKLDEKWEDCLASIFSRYSPVFMGYAGNDKSLMNFLLANAKRFENDEWKCPYWFAYKSEPKEKMVLDFLNNSRSYLILHNGFDGVLIALGTEHGYKLPTKAEFIDESEKRYRALKESFDSYSEQINKQASSDDKGVDSGGEGASGDSHVTTADDGSDTVSELFKKAVSSSNAALLYSEAASKHNNGDYYGALELKKRLIELEPDNARYHDSLSFTLHKMKRYDEALAAAQKAVVLEPDNAHYQDSLGITLHEMKRYDEALAAKKKAVVLEPDNARYQDSLGDTLHQTKRYDEALAAKKKAVELEPDNARYRNSLGDTLHQMKRYDEALAATKKAVALEPDNARYQNSLGITLHRMKRYDEALEAKQKAVALEPENEEYRASLKKTMVVMQNNG